ncbi:MAG: glutaredoxin family protein [Spirochaetes bacterium]|nr:glutaredoxin family protein [Spirochaetota bacterium]
MFDYVDFTEVPGDSRGHELKLFALSTCGFCKRAIAFLKENEVGYSYVYVDRLQMGEKKRVKDEFYKRFMTQMLYPALVIDGNDTLVGFTEEAWKQKLGVE